MNDSIAQRLREEFQEFEARHEYAEDFLNAHNALQIKALRLQRGWSQEQLGKAAGMKQSMVSKYEDVDFRGRTTRTLLRLAGAFDLALSPPKFESFGTLIAEASGLSRLSLERDSFAEDFVVVEAAEMVFSTDVSFDYVGEKSDADLFFSIPSPPGPTGEEAERELKYPRVAYA